MRWAATSYASVSAALQAAEIGVEEARSVLSAVVKSLWAFLQQLAAWVQELLARLFEFMARDPLALIMLLTDVGILLA